MGYNKYDKYIQIINTGNISRQNIYASFYWVLFYKDKSRKFR